MSYKRLIAITLATAALALAALPVVASEIELYGEDDEVVATIDELQDYAVIIDRQVVGHLRGGVLFDPQGQPIALFRDGALTDGEGNAFAAQNRASIRKWRFMKFGPGIKPLGPM